MSGSRSWPGLRGRRAGARPAERPRGRGARRPQPGPGAARRGRHRQDGPARRSSSTEPRDAGSPGRRASSRRWSSPTPACTSCAVPTWTGWAALPDPQRDALGTAFGVRSGGTAGSVPPGPGGADPALRRGGGGAADLRGGRRAVAGPGIGADAGVRRPSTRRRTGGHGLRRAGDRRGARARGPAGARRARAAPRRRGGAARVGGAVAARPPGPRPRPGRVPRQSARAPGAAAAS